MYNIHVKKMGNNMKEEDENRAGYRSYFEASYEKGHAIPKIEIYRIENGLDGFPFTNIH